MVAQMVKNLSACSEGDLGLIPGSGGSSGEGKGYPLQYSSLENSMDRVAWCLPGHSSLVVYSSWGCKESNTTEWLTLSLSPCVKYHFGLSRLH